MKKSIWYLLISLVAVSFGIRIYQLGVLPAVLNRDEAALAYNALLLKEVGTDEWGEPWSLTLQSFGDYKLPGYPALLVALFHVVEPSDFWVRVPSAFAGSLLVLVAYGYGKAAGWKEKYSVLAALAVATTPVFFFYSRSAFEANVALTLLTAAGLVLYAKPYGTLSRTLQDMLGLLLWSAAAVTYNTPLILIPLLLPLIIVGRGVKNYKEWLFPTVFLCTLFAILFSGQAALTAQKSSITIFSDETHRTLLSDAYAAAETPFEIVAANKYVYFAKVLLSNGFETFSPTFLLKKGGEHPLHQMPGSGHITTSLYIFGIYGLLHAAYAVVTAVRKHGFVSKVLRTRGFETLLVYTTFASLVPSASTVDAPHATRSLLFFFCLVLASIYTLKSFRRSIVILFTIVTVLLFVRYLDQYFTVYPTEQPQLLQVGYPAVLEQVQAENRGPVAVVDPDGYHYVITAWYLKTPPSVFYSTVIKQQPNYFGFRYGQQLEKYHFIGKAEDRVETEKTLLEWKEGTWHIQNF